MDSVRFYSADEVHTALSLPALADAIALALRADVMAPLRHAHAISATESLLLMPAWSAQDGAIGVKLVTVFPGNRSDKGAVGVASTNTGQPANRGAEDDDRRPSTVNAVYVMFDRRSGIPRAVIDGEALTLRRTAAASLLAARYLARPDARKVLIVGCGRLARYMAHGHCNGRDISQLSIWGRTHARAESLASTLREDGWPAVAVKDLQLAVAEADIISCATTATAPIVLGAWLAPGVHLDLVGAFKRGMREVDDAAVARSRVYVDTYAGALAEAADVIEPLERRVIQRAHVLGELRELVTGTVGGRRSAHEITLFKSVGTAIEDLAAAQLLLQMNELV
ncbi:MAG: ornithine cyclodeaminase family protein [Burkholderiaceae bacterium]|nr:ornithine cyclodeaminase family protein [Burkholderiaceae bacterium]